MASFENDVVVAKNLNFDQAAAKPHLGIINAAGKFPIGTGNTSPTPEILAGSLTSPDSSITFGYSSPNITATANAGGGLVHTLTGNSGIATSSGGNINVITANSTPKFVGSASTLTQDFSLSNLILGTSGSTITSAVSLVGLGKSVLSVITSGSRNIAIGEGSCQSLQTGENNISIGTLALANTVGSGDNVAIGSQTLGSLAASLGSNVAIGGNALGTITTGTKNIGIGVGSGNTYNGAESSNIIIGNVGVNGESNVIRIGTNGSGSGQQNKAFLAGVTGVTVASSPVAVASTGQLSDLGFGTATQVLTSNGAGVSPTWQAAGGGGSSTTFLAYVSAQITNPTGDGTAYTVIFDSTLNNTGAAYNTGTGVFTAPATGMYHFDTTICFNAIQTTSTSIVIQFSGSVTSVRTFQFQGPTTSLVVGTICYSGGITIPMTAADTMSVIVNVGGLAKNVSIYGGGAPVGTSTVFAGYRVS